MVTGRTPRYERGLLLHLLVLALVNTPFAWHKFTGGVTIEWIGYQLDVGRFEMGITTKRTAWVRNWLAEKNREKDA